MPINWTTSKYGPKVRAFLAKQPQDFAFFTLCDGAVRSGKTLAIIKKIPQIFDFIGDAHLKVFSGYSKSTIRNNVLIELLPYLENYHGAKIKYNSASGELDIKLWGKLHNCLVIGGGKSDSDSAIQGGTWDFWYANELTKHHYSFYNMALTRLSAPNARAFADCNPESQNHWLYKEWRQSRSEDIRWGALRDDAESKEQRHSEDIRCGALRDDAESKDRQRHSEDIRLSAYKRKTLTPPPFPLPEEGAIDLGRGFAPTPNPMRQDRPEDIRCGALRDDAKSGGLENPPYMLPFGSNPIVESTRNEGIAPFEYWHFTMDDNLNLSETYKQTQKQLYSGAFYERKILGQWVVAEGLVYDTFNTEKHTCAHAEILEKISKNDFVEYFIGLDWGWNHPTACLLYGVTKTGVYYQIDELFGSKIEPEKIIEWVESKQKEYARYFSFINADNARPEQNYKLRKSLRLSIYETKPKSVEDSVAIVRSIINYDRLIINKDRCSNTLNELSVYRYPSDSEKLKVSIKEDAPVKEYDDCMDAMRYAVTFYESRYGKRFEGS